MNEISDYKIMKKLYEDSKRVIYRGVKVQGVTSPLPVIIKTLKIEDPDAKYIARLRHEYEVIKNLNIEAILKPYELKTFHNLPALILEDFDGEPLINIIPSGKMELAQFLDIAIKVSEVLGEVHGNGIIHKGMNPQSILINTINQQIKLTEFGISSFYPGESTTRISSIDMVEGTLFYISPEQTGRINRAIDYRSDLYSLGIVFYEMLTGALPFQSEEPLQLVHSHIAKKPLAPHKLNSRIPGTLSKIILKLLSKVPEERYQSTHGLISDLKRCLSDLKSSGKIIDFELGSDDRSPIFTVSQRLYGRETELSTLKEMFNLSSRGERVLVLITGNSGIGKTSLEREFHKSLIHKKVICISGKFERLQQDIPYSGFIQAFKELVDQILMESKEQVVLWKERILKSIGPNGQIIIDVIPQVELIIGKQNQVPELPPAEAQNRFNKIFQNFVSSFSHREQPLIIFLDDLHWADSASLQLLRILSSSPDIKYLLLLGAYRKEEVDSSHPIKRMLDDLKKLETRMITINLNPLLRKHVEYIVSDTLECRMEESLSLAHLVYEKTSGNPFFVNQFLRTLYQKNHTHFDFLNGRWVWDLDKILKADITDNPVRLMTHKIQKLTKTGQRMLKAAACIGNHFTLGTLAEVNNTSPFATLKQLRECIIEGLVLPTGEEYKYIPVDEKSRSEISEISFQFLHDRVQQAAYLLLSSDQKQRLHLRIGKSMLTDMLKTQNDENVCEITDHLNKGRALIKVQGEKYELAGLNLKAGKKAKTSIAYESALRYLNAGIGMLEENSWQDHYELTLLLHVEGAETAYMNADFSRADYLNQTVLMKARTLLDKVRTYEIIIHSYIAQNRYREAVDTASKILNQLGVFLPKNPGRLRILLGLLRTKVVLHGISLDDLYNLPQMTDQYKLAAMRILMGVFNPFYRSIREMFPSIAFRMIILSYKYGNSSISPFAYTLYGLLLGLIGEIVPGYQYGSFALDLFKKYYTQELTAKMYNVFFALMKKWKAHLKESLKPLLEAYQSGLLTGDLEWAAYAIRGYCIQLFFTGKNLETVRHESAKYSETLKMIKQENTYNNIMLIRQASLNLMGRAENSTRLKGECFNEEEMLPVLIDARDTDTIAGIRFHRCMLCYLFEDYFEAFKAFREIEKQRETRGQFGFVLEARFYYSLVLLAVYPQLNHIEQKHSMKIVTTYQKTMRKGAEHAPMNYLHKWYLVEAERERVDGKELRAMEYYDQAIKGARENDYLQDEAMANECAAKFYLKREKKKIASAYMKEAHVCYRRWGASAKVMDLEKKYGNLIGTPIEEKLSLKEPISLDFDSSGIRSGELDLSTVLKASHVISGEIVLDSLLEKVMKIVLEVSGAERGVLILEKEGKYLIEAEGDVGTEKINLLQNTEASEGGSLSNAALNYVIRTKKSIVLKDACEDERFQIDAYILQNRIKSLLCAPIVRQGVIKGILYLENNLTDGAFTEDRVEVVKLIASQAAISFENARLYHSLLADIERRKLVEEELRRSEQMARSLLDALRDSLVLIDPDGKVLSLNRTNVKAYGMRTDEIVGKCLWDMLPAEVAERRRGYVERAIRSVKVIRVVDEQGGRISDNVIYPVVDSEGKVARIAILERDITEQKKVEEQAKIQQLHLMKSDRLAMMGELAAGVAHEINNPNHSIMLNTALLMKAYPDILSVLDEYSQENDGLRIGGFEYTEFKKTLEDSVKRIEECARRIGVIVKELKTFARPEPEDTSESVDVNVTVQSAILLGTPFIKKSTDNFSVQLEENIPKVRGNAQRIEQVLLNLLQNACQSLVDRRKGVSICTSYDRVLHRVIIEVKDEGEGMSEEVLSRIREPFFTTKKESGGTGLGLSISSRIVEEYGGTLNFQSQPGKGTLASVSFPEGDLI